MDREIIKNFLINYGVYDGARGFEMLVDLIENYDNVKNLNECYSKLSEKYNLTINTIKASIRYVVVEKNKYGNNLSVKGLLCVWKMKS